MKPHALLILLASITIILSACADNAEPEPVISAELSQQQLNTIYGLPPGPGKVQLTDMTLARESTRSIPLRIFYGNCESNCPVVLFSHGFASSNSEYDRLLRHWASYGYTVLAPNHADSGGFGYAVFSSIRYGQLGLMNVRIRDLKTIVNQLGRVETRIGQRFDLQKIIAAGHSFGAFSAQQLIGAGVFNSDSGMLEYANDARVVAAIALSPPGPMFDEITEKSWQQLNKPMLIATGTRDAEPRFWPDWTLHKMSFDTAKPGNKFALVIEGADHYLGNLICRTNRDKPPQEHALAMVNAASIAFLDVYTRKQGERASALLNSNYLEEYSRGFARISRR